MFLMKVCDQINDKKFVSIKCLFEGVLNLGLKNKEFGEQVKIYWFLFYLFSKYELGIQILNFLF